MRWWGRAIGLLAPAIAPMIATLGSAQQPAAPGAEVNVWPVQGNVYLAASASANAAFFGGRRGVLVVDSMPEPLADALVAEIRKIAGAKPIRYIVNTHVHVDHTGGNVKLAASAAETPFIWAHESVLTRMHAARRAGAGPVRGMADRCVLHAGEGGLLQRHRDMVTIVRAACRTRSRRG